MQPPSVLALLGAVGVAMVAALPQGVSSNNLGTPGGQNQVQGLGQGLDPSQLIGGGGGGGQAAAHADALASGGGFAHASADALSGGLQTFPCGNPIPGACGGGLPPIYTPPFGIPQFPPFPNFPDPNNPLVPGGGGGPGGDCNTGMVASCCNGNNQGGGGLLGGGILGPIFGGSCLLGGFLGSQCSGHTRCCPTDQQGLLNVNLACGSLIGG